MSNHEDEITQQETNLIAKLAKTLLTAAVSVALWLPKKIVDYFRDTDKGAWQDGNNGKYVVQEDYRPGKVDYKAMHRSGKELESVRLPMDAKEAKVFDRIARKYDIQYSTPKTSLLSDNGDKRNIYFFSKDKAIMQDVVNEYAQYQTNVREKKQDIQEKPEKIQKIENKDKEITRQNQNHRGEEGQQGAASQVQDSKDKIKDQQTAADLQEPKSKESTDQVSKTQSSKPQHHNQPSQTLQQTKYNSAKATTTVNKDKDNRPTWANVRDQMRVKLSTDAKNRMSSLDKSALKPKSLSPAIPKMPGGIL